MGPSPEGTVLLEFVNQSLVIYARNGRALEGAIPAAQVFGVPPNVPVADPRACWDPRDGRWFLTMFTAGQENSSGQLISPSDEFIAVSQTADPLAGYKIFSIDTTDRGQPGCPCYGDFDQVGADRYGFYITTNEFALTGNTYNGAIVYAMSKAKLAEAASQPWPHLHGHGVRAAGAPGPGRQLGDLPLEHASPLNDQQLPLADRAGFPSPCVVVYVASTTN